MTAPQEWLDRADALAAGATEGPWRVGVEGSEGSRVNRDSGDKRADSHALLVCNGLVQPEDGRNAAFIAASRTLVPAMSAALRAVLDEHDRRHGRTSDWCYADNEDWPCATVSAITDALDGAP